MQWCKEHVWLTLYSVTSFLCHRLLCIWSTLILVASSSLYSSHPLLLSSIIVSTPYDLSKMVWCDHANSCSERDVLPSQILKDCETGERTRFPRTMTNMSTLNVDLLIWKSVTLLSSVHATLQVMNSVLTQDKNNGLPKTFYSKKIRFFIWNWLFLFQNVKIDFKNYSKNTVGGDNLNLELKALHQWHRSTHI